MKEKNAIPSFAPYAANRKSERSPARAAEQNFGDVIRTRRRELDLTQYEVASRIKISTPYVGHLEAGKRYPSSKIVAGLAKVLGLDSRQLFLLANPHTQALLAAQPENREGSVSAWEQFRRNEQFQRIHNVPNDEMEMLSQVALLGEIASPRDFIFILNTVRHAAGR